MLKNKKIVIAIICYIISFGLYTSVLFTKEIMFLLLGSAFLCVGAFLMISETIKHTK